MQFYFLPALGSQSGRWLPGGLLSRQYIGRTAITNSPFGKDYHIANWMDDEVRGTEAYYPHLLLTYYWFRNKALQFPDDSFVFGDSGGFSILRKGMSNKSGAPHQRKIDPADVLQWQARMCSVGAALDVPPVTPEGVPIDINSGPLPVTLKNVRCALPAYEKLLAKGTKFRWWGVAHGWDEEQLDHWWSQVSDIYPFTEEGEGWALRARPTSFDPVAVGECLYWLGKHKIQRAHFFAAAGSAAIATILVMGERVGLQMASCDSKAALDFARNRKAFTLIKDGLGYGYELESGAERGVRDYFLNDCTCYSCDRLRDDVKHFPRIETCTYEGAFGNYWFHRFLFHNYLILISIVRTMEEEARKAPDKLLRTVLGKGRYGPVLRAVDGHRRQVAKGFDQSLLDFV